MSGFARIGMQLTAAQHRVEVFGGESACVLGQFMADGSQVS